jgi:hypothetical protein
MPRYLAHALVLSPLLFGCGAPGDTLADWRDKLTLRLVVGRDYGDDNTVPPTSVGVLLPGPDMRSVSPNDVRCPTFDATLLVNGVKLPQLDRGGETDNWFGESDEPCIPPQFGLQGALPAALLSALTRIRVSDDSATFGAELENLVAAPSLAFPAGTAPELHPGSTVTLSVTPPEPSIVDQAVWLWFLSDDPAATAAIFVVSPGQGITSLDDRSITFTVPDITPVSGTLVLEAEALGPQVLGCTGFAGCEIPPEPIISSSEPLAASIVP